MKLRVRINKETTRVELQGEEPSLAEISVQIREVLLPSHGLSPDTDFTLSLNGKEPLSDVGQSLSSAGIVSGDLICVMLPQSLAMSAGPCSATAQSASSSSSATPQMPQKPQQTRTEQIVDQLSNEPSTSGPATTRPVDRVSGMESADVVDTPGPRIQEPMLCSEAEDGQVPLSLDVLHRKVQSSGPCDSIMVAAHLLMVETGFTPHDNELKPGEMPTGWRAAGGAYKLQYTHPLCENSVIMVIGLSMGPVLVINATLKINETAGGTVRKMCLSPSSYVIDEWTGESAAAAAVFKDLAKLSRTFKDQLAYPLIAAARSAMALPPAFGLCVLPPELLLRVLRLLDAPSLVALSAVNRRFHSITADSTLWRHLYRRDFRGHDPSTATDMDWKELYKKKYQLRKRHQRTAPNFQVLPRPPNPFPPHPFFPPFPSGIIGGEYDQRPGLLPRPRFDPLGPFLGQGPPGRRRGGAGPSQRARDIRRGFI